MNPHNLGLYQCFKRVLAAQIEQITLSRPINTQPGTDWLVATLHFTDDQAPISVTRATFEKHQPQRGWYYILYEDGYVSFSPAHAFEAGYAQIDGTEEATPLRAANLALAAAQAELVKQERAFADERRRLQEDMEAAANPPVYTGEDTDYLHRLQGKMSALLARTAEALYGPPADDELHDWSQLPKNAKALRDAADAAAAEFINAASWMVNPPEDMAAKLREILMKRGEQINALGERLLNTARTAYPQAPKGLTAPPSGGKFQPGDQVIVERYRERGEHEGWIVDHVHTHEDQNFYDVKHPNGGYASVHEDGLSLSETCDKDVLCSLFKGHEGDCETIF